MPDQDTQSAINENGATSTRFRETRYRRWTPEQDAELARLVALGWSDAEIARRMRTAVRRVYDRRVHGPQIPAPEPIGGDLVIWLPKANVKIVSRYERGWNPFEHHKVTA